MTYSIRYITEILEEFARSGRDDLDLSETPVTDGDLKELVSQPGCASLKSLCLRSTQITGEGLKHLRHLHSIEGLILGDTRIRNEDLRYLKELHSLKTLTFEQTQVGDDGLRHLKNLRGLERLSIWCTQVGDRGLGYLADMGCLEELDLNTTQIGDEGLKHIQNLRSLKELRLTDALITDDGLEYLCGFNSLRELDLSFTQIGDVGLRHLANLHSLETLSLGGTQVGNQGLKHLVNLKRLSYLALNDCPNVNDITPLEVLLPSNGGALEKLWALPRGLPEEVRHIDKAAEIFNFLRSAATESAPLRELKLLLLGEGRVGKTHLAKWLTKQPTPWRKSTGEDRTIGYAIGTSCKEQTRGQLNEVCFRIFDFGGQPEQHGAHRLFMQSQRNIYAIVLKATVSAKQNRLLYWLRMVRHYAKDAPILLFVTHCENPERRKLELDPLLKNLPPWLRPVRVIDGIKNCTKNDGGHAALLEALNAVAATMDEITHPFPNGLFTVKRWLSGETLTADDHHRLRLSGNAKLKKFDQLMTLKQFKQLCRACGAADRQWKYVWLPLLRNLGIVQWVGDHPTVRETSSPLRTCLFNTRWLCRPIYEIASDPGCAKAHGLMPKRVVLGRLAGEGITRTTAALIRDLMVRTELIFPVHAKVNGSKEVTHYLVPDLIPLSPTVSRHPPESSCMAVLHYGRFLPDSVLLRFIGRHSSMVMVPFVENAYRNKVRIASADGKHKALIEADYAKRTIAIHVSPGYVLSGREFAFRQWIIDDFHRYPKPKRIELMPQSAILDGGTDISGVWGGTSGEHRTVYIELMNILLESPRRMNGDTALQIKSIPKALEIRGIKLAQSTIYRRLSESLCRALRQSRNRCDLPFRIDTQLVEIDPAAGEDQGRMDIVFSPPVPRENIYFCMECKRLNVRESNGIRPYFAEYVRFGMFRFVRGQYANSVRNGAMLAYVLDGDVAGAIIGVENNIRNLETNLGMDSPGAFLTSTVRPGETRLRETRHLRAGHPDLFVIHHLFMAGDPNAPLRLKPTTGAKEGRKKRKPTARKVTGA